MLLFEFYERAPDGWQDLDQDNSAPKWGDARKTKLTLGQLAKLRKMKEVMAFERAKDLKNIRKQYSPQPAETGGL